MVPAAYVVIRSVSSPPGRYILLYPLIWLIAKSSKAAEQTVLHALFLPTPFKRALAQVNAAVESTASTKPDTAPENHSFEEVIKPGALYRECAVVNVRLPPLPAPPKEQEDAKEKAKGKKGKEKEKEDFVELEDDGELGGELLGRMVWEWYESRLKEWEAKEKAALDEEKRHAEKSAKQPESSS